MGDIYASILLNLVRKGYIELERIDNTKAWNPNNVLIKILYNQFTSENILNNIIHNKMEMNQNIQPVQIDKYNSNGKKLEDLSMNEKSYFNLIVKYANNKSITLKDFQNKINHDYDSTDTFVTSVENSIVNIGVSHSYFQKANYLEVKDKTHRLARTYLITAFVLIIVCNFMIYHTRLDLAFGSFFIVGFTLVFKCDLFKKERK